jgi:hypothetical protein
MRKKLKYIRLSAQEEQELIELSEEWGCRRSEVLRFAFRSFLLNMPGKALNSEWKFQKPIEPRVG